MERLGEAPISPLYRRLMTVSRLTCQQGKTTVSHINISPSATFGEPIRLEIFFRDGTRDTQHLLPDGSILKGGLTSDEQLVEVQRVICALAVFLPSESRDDFPGIIRIPREAFKTEQQKVRNGGNGSIPRPSPDRSIDPRRRNALRDGVVLFEFDVSNGAFSGYICAVYPHGIFLDMPHKENAAFEYHIPNFLVSIGIDPLRGRLTDDEIERIQTHITTILLPTGTTKREFVDMGARRICHIGRWEARIRHVIDRLLRGL